MTKGWWHNQVLDSEGKKTQQYNKLKAINAEIKSIADEYMKYRRTSTHFVGFGENNPELENIKYESLDELNTGVFTEFRTDSPCVVGEMTSRVIILRTHCLSLLPEIHRMIRRTYVTSHLMRANGKFRLSEWIKTLFLKITAAVIILFL